MIAQDLSGVHIGRRVRVLDRRVSRENQPKSFVGVAHEGQLISVQHTVDESDMKIIYAVLRNSGAPQVMLMLFASDDVVLV